MNLAYKTRQKFLKVCYTLDYLTSTVRDQKFLMRYNEALCNKRLRSSRLSKLLIFSFPYKNGLFGTLNLTTLNFVVPVVTGPHNTMLETFVSNSVEIGS